MDILNDTSLIINVNIPPHSTANFLNWQSRFRSQATQSSGFKSLEILSPLALQNHTWMLKLRFISKKDLNLWLKSKPYEQLSKELANNQAIDHSCSSPNKKLMHDCDGVTEVYITLVNPEKIKEFYQWHEKIHQIETSFPGFQKIYIQAPDQQRKEDAWITLLQFDHLANLENWHNAPERLEILKESDDFVTSKETHRLLSSFGGWFADSSLSKNPPSWKQSMLILAVLFPIVMLQHLYLTPYLNFITPSLKTFIENVICVILMAWPMLPLAIYGLKWWLELQFNPIKELLGIGILMIVYGTEIFLFWMLTSS